MIRKTMQIEYILMTISKHKKFCNLLPMDYQYQLITLTLTTVEPRLSRLGGTRVNSPDNRESR